MSCSQKTKLITLARKKPRSSPPKNLVREKKKKKKKNFWEYTTHIVERFDKFSIIIIVFCSGSPNVGEKNKLERARFCGSNYNISFIITHHHHHNALFAEPGDRKRWNTSKNGCHGRTTCCHWCEKRRRLNETTRFFLLCFSISLTSFFLSLSLDARRTTTTTKGIGAERVLANRDDEGTIVLWCFDTRSVIKSSRRTNTRRGVLAYKFEQQDDHDNLCKHSTAGGREGGGNGSDDDDDDKIVRVLDPMRVLEKR